MLSTGPTQTPPRGIQKDGEHMITLDFSKIDGLVPAIVQDYQTGEVLMLAFMNEAAWEATLRTGKATYFSRSRQTLWDKGRDLRPRATGQGNPHRLR